MKRFIFGFDDAHPHFCAQDLKNRGFDAVIVNGISRDGAVILREAGIDLYLCFGAHTLGDAQPRNAHLALNPQGESRVWFASACPDDSEIADARLAQALQIAQELPGLKGIFVDGARFASFASPEGMDAFFSCFCPRCIARMQSLGPDAEAIRRAVQHLALPGPMNAADVPHLRNWLHFMGFRVAHAVPGLSPCERPRLSGT